jgi:site-specific recombinase XerD
MKDFIKTFETGRHTRSSVWKSNTSLRSFLAFIEAKGMNPDKWENITSEVLDGYRKSLTESGKKEAGAGDYIFKVRQFLSFVERKRGLTVPGLHKTETVKLEGVENYPAEFQKAYYDYSKAVTKQGRPKRSIQRVKFMIRAFYRYLTEERQVKRFIEIRRTDVKEFTRFLMDLNDTQGNKRYSISSVNIFLTTIRGFLIFLSKQGLCMGLADLVHCVKQEDCLSKNILNRKELVKLFNIKAESLEEFMMKTIIILLYGSGIRIGEALTLRLKDVDLEKKEVYIFETKTNKERTVQLGEVAAGYLRLYIDGVREYINYNQEKETQFQEPQSQEARLTDYTFVSLERKYSFKKKLTPETVNKYLKKFCRRAGIKKLITCHCFRHSFGSHLLENGAGIKEVSELLGHEDLTTTERYTRLNPEHLRQTILKYHPREHFGELSDREAKNE